MKVSDYVVSFLASKGITDVFGYPGGMVTHLMESFDKYGEKIVAHTNYNEQASALCACGYAQATHKPGVAYATSGPGATNLVTGIANAYFDSIPTIFITGQVNTYESKGDLPIRQKGFQETDIVSIVKSITKYVVQVNCVEEIRYAMEKAYLISMEGRQGPVLVDIPMDIQRADVEPEFLKGYICDEANNNESLDTILDSLKVAKRPCVLIGAGVKTGNAKKMILDFIDKVEIPVVSSMIAFDVMGCKRDNYYGFIGAYGHRKANFIISKSDLIISFGSRLDCRQTGSDKHKFSPNAKIIRVDVDENEFRNMINEDDTLIVNNLSMGGGGTLSIKGNIELLHNFKRWNEACIEIALKLDEIDNEKPNNMIKGISKYIPDNVYITTDVGQNQVWVAQSFLVKPNQTVLFSGGHGTMGYSLPAAIGAYYGSKKNVFSINGDGGIQMNIQELQLIAREKLPIKVIILNNNSLGMIRHFQEMYFESNFVQTVKNRGYSAPDFSKISDAYGLDYYKITSISDLNTEMFIDDKPAIIEVLLDEITYLYPKLAINKPIQDQEPSIDRKLYNYLSEL